MTIVDPEPLSPCSPMSEHRTPETVQAIGQDNGAVVSPVSGGTATREFWGKLGTAMNPGTSYRQASAGGSIPLQASRYASPSSRASGKPRSATAWITSRARQ
jgi:hypothetical protein